MTGPSLVLVGPPGAGKTTVGTELARRMGTTFLDTDQIIEADEGVSVADIFVDQGEAVFRDLEEQAVASALASDVGVVALGGGAVLSARTRQLLRELPGTPIVFLDVGLAEAVSRVGLGSARPLLFGNVRAQLKALLDERRDLYLRVATDVVGTDRCDIAEVVDRVERAIS